MRLTIPPNTHLYSIDRLPYEWARWAIWIHTSGDELKRPHNERNGTYLLLNEDGSVDRTTVSGGVVVDLIEVMPKR